MNAWMFRRNGHFKSLASFVTGTLLLFVMPLGCLQQEDLNADVLTSFEERSPSAPLNTEDATSDESQVHIDKVHVDMPPGGNANAAILGESPKPEALAENPLSADTTAETALAQTGKTEAQLEKAGTSVPSAPNDTDPLALAPASHPHREMPPGYGSDQPPEPQPEEVPLPEILAQPSPPPNGGQVGEPEKIRPAVTSPFEDEYQGQKFVTVSGVITADVETEAPVDIDCFVTDPSTRAGRKLVNKIKLDGLGPYEMKVPADYGDLTITAFMDIMNDGPNSRDPQGAYTGNPLSIQGKDIKGVDIALKSRSSEVR